MKFREEGALPEPVSGHGVPGALRVGLCPRPSPVAPSAEGFPHGLMGRGPCARHLAESIPEADGWGGPWEQEEPGRRGDSVAWCAGLG